MMRSSRKKILMMEHSVIFPDHRKVCALGQGTWKMGKSALREADEIDALRAGIELGMSVVDTAEMYGNEEMVGAAIRGLRDVFSWLPRCCPATPAGQEPKRPANGA